VIIVGIDDVFKEANPDPYHISTRIVIEVISDGWIRAGHHNIRECMPGVYTYGQIQRSFVPAQMVECACGGQYLW